MDKTLICDLDDVLWELVPVWCEEYNKLNPYEKRILPKQFKQWDLSSVLSYKQYVEFYKFLDEDVFWTKVYEKQDMNKMIENRACLKQLMSHYDVYITTATSYKNKHKLDLFFKLYDFFDKDKLILIKNKWLINTDVIIDDNADVLTQFDSDKTRLIKIDKPWNEWFECEHYPEFTKVAYALLGEV